MRRQLVEVASTPRSKQWQGALGEVFEVAEPYWRPMGAVNCTIGGWGRANMAREEGGVNGLSESR